VIAPAAGTYAYVASTQGTQNGSTTITVARNANGTTTITESGAGTFQGMAGTAKATLGLANDLAPASYSAHVEVGGNVFDSTATIAGKQATLVGIGGTQTYSVPAGGHFVVLDGGLISGFVALPSQVATWPAAAPLELLAPIYSQGATLIVDPAAKPDRPLTVPAADASVTVTGPIALVEWYDPTTMIPDELDVPSQGLVISRKR
jgi:hypothetical protein